MGSDHQRALSRLTRHATRNWRWGRDQGWLNLLEEHDLDPRVRLPRAVRKATWLVRHRKLSGMARVVLLVGAQRSGTNMIAHGLDQAPEVQVYNEGNRRAFRDYQLRELAVIESLVTRSHRPFVLFKPLCDSDRTDELLDHFGAHTTARAIWAYRDVDGRVRSHVRKFGTSNLEAFRAFVDGRNVTSWQVRGLSEPSAELVRSLDVHRMTPETASALFWYVRNLQYFEHRLDQRPDVMLAAYGGFLSHPEDAMRRLCAFIGFPYRAELVAHIDPQPRTARIPVAVDARVRELCDELEERLAAACAAETAPTAGLR